MQALVGHVGVRFRALSTDIVLPLIAKRSTCRQNHVTNWEQRAQLESPSTSMPDMIATIGVSSTPWELHAACGVMSRGDTAED